MKENNSLTFNHKKEEIIRKMNVLIIRNFFHRSVFLCNDETIERELLELVDDYKLLREMENKNYLDKGFDDDERK